MKKLSVTFVSASIMILFLSMVVLFSANAQNTIPIPSHGTNFSGNSRGYWFTAPCDFVVTGLRAPTDYSTAAQSIQLVKFPTSVATWPSTSTSFTTLYYATNLTDTCFVNVNIPIKTGDVIGVITVRDDGSGTSVTSYTSAIAPVTSNIGPYSVSLERFGTQQNIINSAGSSFWTEAGFPIGRAEIRYELPEFNIPIPPHGSAFTGNSRGMWFTAPTNFVITGARAPNDFNTNAQTIHLVKFTAAPASYPSTTTTYTTLFYGTQADTNYIQMNIPVNTGDIIGVIAVRNNGSGTGVTSYTSANAPITSSIGTYNITLARLGWQGDIISGAATNFWTETGLPIGRTEIRIEQPAFYNFSTGSTIPNSFPFLETPSGNNKRQWIYYPSNFSCTPPGYITKIYLKASDVVSPNFNGLLIRMGETNLNTFPDGNFVTSLDTMLYAPTINLHSIVNNWIPINLQKPFYYSGNSNFILEVSHQGFSPGFYVLQTTLTGRTIYGNSGISTGTVQDRLAHLGFEVVNTLDAALMDFSGLPNTFCEGVSPVFAILKNNSPYIMNNATLHWMVNSNTQPSYFWTGTLNPGSIENVQIGTFNFIGGNYYNIEAYVSNPNNLIDIVNYNDTIRKINLFAAPNPVVNLGNDLTVVMGSSVTLDAGAGFTSYLWSTGANTQTIMVDSTGIGVGTKTIWVEVENSYSCADRDTINIDFVDDTGLDEIDNNAQAEIIPNPSGGPFEMHFTFFPPGEIYIQLFNVQGKKVLQLKSFLITGNETISIIPGEIPDGLYIVKIFGNFKTISRKLVIKTE
jgi:hypothetical protein